MPFGMKVVIGPGHAVLDGTQLPPKEAPQPPPFCPCLLWPNGKMDQDATWSKGLGLGPGDIVLDGNPVSPRKWAQQPPPHFSAHVYCGQTVAHLNNC